MQRRPPIDTGRGRVKPETEHEVGRVEALMEDCVGQVTMILACKRRQKRRILSENSFRRRLVRAQERIDESDPRRASCRQQIVNIAMAEFQRDVVRRHAEADRPAVNVEGRNRWIPALVDASGDAVWIGVQQASCQSEVPESGRP